MAEIKTPHLDKWKSTFAKVGEYGKSALRELTPNIHESIDNTADVLRESRELYRKGRTQINKYSKIIESSIANKNAMEILKGAYSDLESGSFSLDQLTNSSLDMIDDFDDELYNSVDEETGEIIEPLNN